MVFFDRFLNLGCGCSMFSSSTLFHDLKVEKLVFEGKFDGPTELEDEGL